MILKISPDKERAKSILKMAEDREKFLKKSEKIISYPTFIAENYYEIIKELCVAIGLAEGYKSTGMNAHKEIIDFIKKYNFAEADIRIIQELRIRRNKSSYEGKPIEKIYLENNKQNLLKIILKLKNILKKLIKD